MSIQIKRILYPTDFSESSEHALTYALSFAEQYGAAVYLLHVIEPITAVPAIYFDPAMTFEDRPELEKNVEQLLNEAVPKEVKERIEIKPLIRRGAPFLEIIRTAREEEIDLIIIATHGRTGLAHMLLGSTAERVVQKAPCPVLSVKHPEHEFVMP
ncbi:MAG: universal stress protein [candidate division Zixibacteria bacterium]|nr:universal stress protein [candidate division Zixibacteria bacterium]